MTRKHLDGMTAREPLWQDFQTALGERRKIGGTLGEAANIVEDPSATTVIKAKKDEVPILKVPSHVKHLYIWSYLLETAALDIDQYKKGLKKAISAVSFGRNIKELYRFNKELRESSEKAGH